MISLGHYNVMLMDFGHLNDKSCHISFSALKKGPVGSAASEPLDIVGGAGGRHHRRCFRLPALWSWESAHHVLHFSDR